MNIDKAKKILRPAIDDDGGLSMLDEGYINLFNDTEALEGSISINGDFSLEQLEAIAVYWKALKEGKP